MRPLRQIALFVEQDGQIYLAHWIEYPAGSNLRTHLAVVEYTSTLLPRDKVALGLRFSAYDLTLEQARARLAVAGYRILRELGPDA